MGLVVTGRVKHRVVNRSVCPCHPEIAHICQRKGRGVREQERNDFFGKGYYYGSD